MRSWRFGLLTLFALALGASAALGLLTAATALWLVDWHGGGQRVSIYAQVSDLQATLDRAEKLGGKTILPPTEVPGGPKLAMFADPAGNVTGLLLGKQPD